MKVEIDSDRFDALQMEVASAITHHIYTAMKRAGVPDSDGLEKIVADALFHVGEVIDGSRVFDSAEGEMQAVLTFRAMEEADTLISAPGGGSWIHEYAFGVAEEYFDRVWRREPNKPPTAKDSRPNLLDFIPGGWFKGRPSR